MTSVFGDLVLFLCLGISCSLVVASKDHNAAKRNPSSLLSQLFKRHHLEASPLKSKRVPPSFFASEAYDNTRLRRVPPGLFGSDSYDGKRQAPGPGDVWPYGGKRQAPGPGDLWPYGGKRQAPGPGDVWPYSGKRQALGPRDLFGSDTYGAKRQAIWRGDVRLKRVPPSLFGSEAYDGRLKHKRAHRPFE